MHHDSDLIVIGAGPAGLVLALLLARKGHQVALLERWPQPYPQPRAIGLDHEARRIIHQAGVDDRIEPLLETTEEHAQYVTPDGEVLLTMASRSKTQSGWEEMVCFNQPDVEQLIEESIIAEPRITVLRNCIATGITQTDDGVSVTYASGDGNGNPLAGAPEKTLTARYLVGCDGANSVTARSIGTEYVDLGFSSDWLVVDIRPKFKRQWKPYLAEVLDPGRPTTVAPSGPGRRRFEFMFLPGEDRETMRPEEVTWRLLAPWDVTPDNAELVRTVPYRFLGRWAAQWRDRRIFLAGDAAHLTPPFLGQGFNSAVRDSANLAQYLNLVLHGTAAPGVLDFYEQERLPHLKAMVETAVQMAHLICVTDPVAAKQRNAQLRAMHANGPLVIPRVPIGHGLIAPGDPLAGTLGYQGRVEYRGKSGRFDEICANGDFVLLGLDADPAILLDEQTRQFWNRLGGKSFHIGSSSCRDLDGTYTEWLAETGARFVLIRPDYYVFGSGKDAADVERLVALLRAMIEA